MSSDNTSPDSTTPADPVGHAALTAAGATGVVTADVLWLLQTYVWHGSVPPAIVGTVWLVVPYVASIIAGRMARRRRLNACSGPIPPAPTDPVDPPADEPVKRP